MGAQIKLEGVAKFDEKIEKMKAKSDEAARIFVTVGGQIVTATARRQFTTAFDASGKIARSGANTNGPGGPPNIRSGVLARSIKVAHIRKGSRGIWESETGPTAIYGRRVELGFRGTDSRGRRFDEPNPFHPYLRPGLEKSMPDLKELHRRLFLEANNG